MQKKLHKTPAGRQADNTRAHVGGLTADTVTTWVAAYLRWNTHETDEIVNPTKSRQRNQVLLHKLHFSIGNNDRLLQTAVCHPRNFATILTKR